MKERIQKSEFRRPGTFVPPLQGSDLVLHPTQGYALGYFMPPRWGSGGYEAQTEPWALAHGPLTGLALSWKPIRGLRGLLSVVYCPVSAGQVSMVPEAGLCKASIA